MNTYTVKVYCDRQGVEVDEEVTLPDNYPLAFVRTDLIEETNDKLVAMILTIAEEQHGGQCGTKREPCMTEANSFEVKS